MTKTLLSVWALFAVCLSACGGAPDSQEEAASGDSEATGSSEALTAGTYHFNGTHFVWWGGECYTGYIHPSKLVNGGTKVKVVATHQCDNGTVVHIEGSGLNGWTFASYLKPGA